MNLPQWLSYLKNWYENAVEKRAEKHIVKYAQNLRLRIATATPVATGRAAASWNLSRGGPNRNPKPDGYLNPGGAPYDGHIDISGYKLGEVLYIANGVEYLIYLNYGSSSQAPAGFIESAILESRLDWESTGEFATFSTS